MKKEVESSVVSRRKKRRRTNRDKSANSADRTGRVGVIKLRVKKLGIGGPEEVPMEVEGLTFLSLTAFLSLPSSLLLLASSLLLAFLASKQALF